MRHISALFIALVLLAQGLGALSMEYQDRLKLDLSRYTVTDPEAGYFDVAARRTYLKTVKSPLLLNEISRHRNGVSCRSALEMPVIDYEVTLPGFYVDHEGWQKLAVIFQAFEDTVSELAASQMVASDDYHANCLIDVLGKWAERRAFENFHYTPTDRQAWYQVESSLFAAALALSTVRDLVPERSDDLKAIDQWMLRLAHRHAKITGLPSDSCCNNHLYRRATYAAIIGIMNSDNELFRFAVSAIYSALSDTSPDGGLTRELIRGYRAIHYQNFGTMYLIFLAEMLSRQGYDMYNLEYAGHTITDIVNYTVDLIEDPLLIKQVGVDDDQDLGFLADGQYLSWMEIWLTHHDNPRMEAIIAPDRPVHNRSLGGYATLFFYKE